MIALRIAQVRSFKTFRLLKFHLATKLSCHELSPLTCRFRPRQAHPHQAIPQLAAHLVRQAARQEDRQGYLTRYDVAEFGLPVLTFRPSVGVLPLPFSLLPVLGQNDVICSDSQCLSKALCFGLRPSTGICRTCFFFCFFSMKHFGMQRRVTTLIHHASRLSYRLTLPVRLVVYVTEFRYLHQLHFCPSLDNLSVTKAYLRYDVSSGPFFAMKVKNIFDELLESALCLDL